MLDPAATATGTAATAEGQAVRISVESSTAADPLADPYLVLYGPDGAEMARDDDGGAGLNAYIEHQATTAGAYFVEARGFDDDARGRYMLSIVGGEIGQSVDAADHIQPGPEGRTSVVGAPDDADWFAVEMIEGRPYRFSVRAPTPMAWPILISRSTIPRATKWPPTMTAAPGSTRASTSSR